MATIEVRLQLRPDAIDAKGRLKDYRDNQIVSPARRDEQQMLEASEVDGRWLPYDEWSAAGNPAFTRVQLRVTLHERGVGDLTAEQAKEVLRTVWHLLEHFPPQVPERGGQGMTMPTVGEVGRGRGGIHRAGDARADSLPQVRGGAAPRDLCAGLKGRQTPAAAVRAPGQADRSVRRR